MSRLFLLCLLGFTTSVIADEPGMQISPGWTYNGITHDAPSHRFYNGTITPIKDGNTYLAWYKAEFLHSQDSKEGRYLKEAILIEIWCKDQVYQIRRDVRYDAKGKVVSDHAFAEGVNTRQYREMDLGGEIDTGKMPLAESFFVLAMASGATCMKPLDGE